MSSSTVLFAGRQRRSAHGIGDPRAARRVGTASGHADGRLAASSGRRAGRRRQADPAPPSPSDDLSVMDLVLRAVAVFAFVMVLTRVIGRRELASRAPSDLILLVILGDALQQGLTQDDYSETGAVLVVGRLAALQVATSWITRNGELSFIKKSN